MHDNSLRPRRPSLRARWYLRNFTVGLLVTVVGGVLLYMLLPDDAPKPGPGSALPGTTPTIQRFEATPAQILEGGASTLTWSIQDAVSAEITPGVGAVPLNGNCQVSPEGTTTYVLRTASARAQTTASATVHVRKPTIDEKNSVGTLPGDGIISFRVIQKQDDHMEVELTHTFNSNHGPVWIGSCLFDAQGTDLSLGFVPAAASPTGKSAVRVVAHPTMRNVRSKELFFWLYEAYKAEGFICRRFPYDNWWGVK